MKTASTKSVFNAFKHNHEKLFKLILDPLGLEVNKNDLEIVIRRYILNTENKPLQIFDYMSFINYFTKPHIEFYKYAETGTKLGNIKDHLNSPGTKYLVLKNMDKGESLENGYVCCWELRCENGDSFKCYKKNQENK